MRKSATITDVRREAKRVFGSTTWVDQPFRGETGWALHMRIGSAIMSITDLTKLGTLEQARYMLSKLERRGQSSPW